MATFFMYGKYTTESLKSISADRTQKAADAIAKAGGKLVSAYALLGKYDLVAITDFPGVKEVMKASIALNKLTGISFTSFPAITVAEFDKLNA
ncbi:MAG TPA: GYD domain-containing protein [Candidatus Omnitrophota bacterium]|nr:GYD domain-containing protein [Candidatus Omnitrophota bacterium]